MPVNEEALVQRARAGDTDAFAKLVAEHQSFVYNLALRTLGDPHEAEDLVQEAFVRAWLALPRFRGRAKFQTWLYRIVVNLCYNRLPRLRRDLSAEADEQINNVSGETFANPGLQVEINEQRAFLHQQIETLPEKYRLLITLRYQSQLTYEEIAQVLNMPLGTVKTGIFRARTRLREALRKFEE